MYNTRIAPAPSGDMHLGNCRTAYFNWLAARATGGRFILRIDDTDQKRNRGDQVVQDILEVMDWLGLNFDELVHQSSRLETYRKFLDNLPAGTVKELEGAVIYRPQDRHIPRTWNDTIIGDVSVSPDEVELIKKGLVLIKSDGYPTYHWSCVVDDIDLNINYIIRGQDHVTGTARQISLYSGLGYSLPKFAHVGLVHYHGKPLSKRDGAASMLSYKRAGYHPEAVLNTLARLGWGPSVDDRSTRLLPKARMLELFLENGKMRSSAANLDLAKLEAYNRKYKAKHEMD